MGKIDIKNYEGQCLEEPTFREEPKIKVFQAGMRFNSPEVGMNRQSLKTPRPPAYDRIFLKHQIGHIILGPAIIDPGILPVVNHSLLDLGQKQYTPQTEKDNQEIYRTGLEETQREKTDNNSQPGTAG